MEKSAISQAIKMICEEKGISEQMVIETIEAALAAAYRKDFGTPNQNIKVEFDTDTAGSKVFDVKTVVEDMELPTEEELKALSEKRAVRKEAEKAAMAAGSPVAPSEEEKRFNPKTDIMISEAKKIKKGAAVGDVIKTEMAVPAAYGRMAAQTAKQVITQKLREAERNTIYEEFKGKEGEIMIGVVQRREGRVVLVDIGRAVGILTSEQQVMGERYMSGQRIKVYIVSVNLGPKGPEIILSRSHPDVVRKLFTFEIPEIANGSIEIKSIAREAGFRSKVAVFATRENIDPIGSCVGQRGTRIQTIISELGGEKIDVIEYNEEISQFITNSLSPAKVTGIEVKEDEKTAYVTVADDQLSLAIGKAGQNVRLAAKLTGWKINIKGEKTGETVVSDGETAEGAAIEDTGEAKTEAVAEVASEAKTEEVKPVENEKEESKAKDKK